MGERSIFEHISAHVPREGPGLSGGGWALPDDDEVPSHLRWPPGAADGVRVLLGAVERDEDTARTVSASMLAALRSGSAKDYDRLEGELRATDVVTYVDPLLELVPALRAPPDRVYDLARRLVTTSPHRASVKVGMSLFGFFEAGYHVDALLALGRHDELTLYAVRALARGLDDPVPPLWELARNTRGWGRVHAVRRLAGTAASPDVHDWMLREGIRNDLGDEYVALPVAVAARLADALATSERDAALLDGMSRVVRALLRGAVEGIDRYDDGADAVARLVDVLATRVASPFQVAAVVQVERFVSEEGDWRAREAIGWSPELRRRLYASCGEILGRPASASIVAAGLASPDGDTFRAASEAALRVGVDAVPALLQRVRSRPLDDQSWLDLMAKVDAARVPAVLHAAAVCLPLADIATGAASALASAPEYRAHACLDSVLSHLSRWPGEGWPLIRAGLASPVVRNRNLALAALERWGRRAWPNDAASVLALSAASEPEVEVRRRIERLLSA